MPERDAAHRQESGRVARDAELPTGPTTSAAPRFRWRRLLSELRYLWIEWRLKRFYSRPDWRNHIDWNEDADA